MDKHHRPIGLLWLVIESPSTWDCHPRFTDAMHAAHSGVGSAHSKTTDGVALLLNGRLSASYLAKANRQPRELLNSGKHHHGWLTPQCSWSLGYPSSVVPENIPCH